MVVIGRMVSLAMSNIPACRAFLRCSVSCIIILRSLSAAPSLIASRRLTSSLPKRHAFRLPSAVMRTRLHAPQKCSVIDVMNPTRPFHPSTCHSFETALGASSCLTRENSGYFPLIFSTNSWYGTSFELSHRLPSNGIYSMKRTSSGRSSASAAKPSTSSSLTPLMITAFTFVLIPWSKQVWTESITFSMPFLRVRSWNLKGSNVSSDTFTESKPAVFSSGTFLPNVIPFVVMAISRSPNGLSSEVAATMS
mmetsp:Transcript_16535/g.23117  ORF Transcript_16535/g.23117 Transcript_16535/m.23117 type:complete len:251 (+) Transcript_16535:295-1047(+)